MHAEIEPGLHFFVFETHGVTCFLARKRDHYDLLFTVFLEAEGNWTMCNTQTHAHTRNIYIYTHIYICIIYIVALYSSKEV